MKSIFSLTLVLIISGFCFGQVDSVAIEKVQPIEEISSSVKVPKFSNADVQKFAEEYSVFYSEMIKAAKEENHSKLTELQTSAVEWAQRSQEVITKMTTEDMQKWTEWAQALAENASKQ